MEGKKTQQGRSKQPGKKAASYEYDSDEAPLKVSKQSRKKAAPYEYDSDEAPLKVSKQSRKKAAPYEYDPDEAPLKVSKQSRKKAASYEYDSEEAPLKVSKSDDASESSESDDTSESSESDDTSESSESDDASGSSESDDASGSSESDDASGSSESDDTSESSSDDEDFESFYAFVKELSDDRTRKDSETVNHSTLDDELLEELDAFSKYDDDQLYVPKIEETGDARCISLLQDKYFTREEETNFRSSVPFLHWFLLRTKCDPKKTGQNLPIDDSRKIALPQTTAISAGLRVLMQKRTDHMRAECKRLHREGRHAWHSLVNMCILLDDFCNASTKNFKNKDGQAQWRKYMRIMHDIIDVQEHSVSLSRKFAEDAGLNETAQDNMVVQAMLHSFVGARDAVVNKALRDAGEEQWEMFRSEWNTHHATVATDDGKEPPKSDGAVAKDAGKKPKKSDGAVAKDDGEEQNKLSTIALKSLKKTIFWKKMDKITQEYLIEPLFKMKFSPLGRTPPLDDMLKQLKPSTEELKQFKALQHILTILWNNTPIAQIREQLSNLYQQESRPEYENQKRASVQWLHERRKLLDSLPTSQRLAELLDVHNYKDDLKIKKETFDKTPIILTIAEDSPLTVSAKQLLEEVKFYLESTFTSLRKTFGPASGGEGSTRMSTLQEALEQTQAMWQRFDQGSGHIIQSLQGEVDMLNADKDDPENEKEIEKRMSQVEGVFAFAQGEERERKVRAQVHSSTIFQSSAMLERTLLACHVKTKQKGGVPLIVDVFCSKGRPVLPKGLTVDKLQQHWGEGEKGILDVHLASLDNAMCQDGMCRSAVQTLRTLVPVIKALMTDEEWSDTTREAILTKCKMKQGSINPCMKTVCETIEKACVFYDDVGVHRRSPTVDNPKKVYEGLLQVALHGVSKRDKHLAMLYNARLMSADGEMKQLESANGEMVACSTAEQIQKDQRKISRALNRLLIHGSSAPVGVNMFRPWEPLLFRPWEAWLEPGRVFAPAETDTFLQEACWRSALPVKGEPPKARRSRASSGRVDGKLLKTPVSQVSQALPELDVERLSTQDRGPAIDVYKKLRRTAEVSGKLVDAMLKADDAAVESSTGDAGEDSGAGVKRQREGAAAGLGLQLSWLDSQIDATCEADWTSADSFLRLVKRIKSKELARLRCFCSLDGQTFVMKKGVRNNVLPKLDVDATQKEAPVLMFHCGDDVVVNVPNTYSRGQETGFYKKKLQHTLRYFTAEQMQKVEEEYERLAMAEDFHMKLSYMVADSVAMLKDVVGCLNFLLDKFGCDRWPLRESGLGPQAQRDGTSPLPCEHDLVELASPWKFQFPERDLYLPRQPPEQRSLSEAAELWKRGIKRRDPFVSMVMECTRQEGIIESKTSDLDYDMYISDVSAIRKAIYTVLKKRKSVSADTDDEEDVG